MDPGRAVRDGRRPKRLATSGVSYSGRTDPAVLHARLTAAPRGAVGDDGSAHAHITRALVAALRSLVEQIKVLTEQIGTQLAGHADAHIFTSLPRSGTVRAARLLAEIGDCRARFLTPSRWPASPPSPVDSQTGSIDPVLVDVRIAFGSSHRTDLNYSNSSAANASQS